MELSGTGLDFLIAFAGGVLISFTPCIYPLIPVAAGYIGSRSGGSKLRGFILGLFYVGGMSFVYSALGVIAVLTGRIFGAFSASPAANFIAGGLIIFFALAMFDVLALPHFMLPQFRVSNKGGYLAVFLLGAGSGLVMSPCLSPVLGSILAYLTTKKNLFYGMVLLFSFAWGMGLLLILVGIFSSAIFRWLPKAGRWLVYVKRGFAAVMLLAGAYFIYLGVRRLI